MRKVLIVLFFPVFLFTGLWCTQPNQPNQAENNQEQTPAPTPPQAQNTPPPAPPKPPKPTAVNGERAIAPNEEHVSFDPAVLNQKIRLSKRTDLTPQDIIQMHYDEKPQGEGNEQIVIKEVELSNGNVEVAILHLNLPDDSMKDVKHVVELTKNGDQWKAVSVKKNFRCHEGRGHTRWGIGMCN